MDIGEKIGLFFFGLFALVGTICAIVAYYNWHNTYRIVQNGIQTQGMVIEHRRRPTKGLEAQSTSLAVTVQFVTTDGKVVKYYSNTYTTPVTHQIGEAVTLWYLKDDPQTLTLDGVDAWLVPVVCGIFGFVFCLIGYPSLIRALFKQG